MSPACENVVADPTDFLSAEGGILDWIPLSGYSMGWVLPALLVFIFVSILNKNLSQE